MYYIANEKLAKLAEDIYIKLGGELGNKLNGKVDDRLESRLNNKLSNRLRFELEVDWKLKIFLVDLKSFKDKIDF